MDLDSAVRTVELVSWTAFWIGLVFSVSVVLLIATLLTWGLYWLLGARPRAIRALRGMPRTRANDVAPGSVARVVGRILPREGDAQLVAPLSGRPCVAYHVLLERHEVKLDRARTDSVIRIFEQRQVQDFVLEDESGQSLVLMEDAVTAESESLSLRFGYLQQLDPRLSGFLEARRIDPYDTGLPKRLVCTETLIPCDRPVAVGARWNEGPEKKRVAASSPGQKLYVSDLPECLA